MKRQTIPDKLWKKLDKTTQAQIENYYNNEYKHKGPSEKIETWISEKIKEVS